MVCYEILKLILVKKGDISNPLFSSCSDINGIVINYKFSVAPITIVDLKQLTLRDATFINSFLNIQLRDIIMIYYTFFSRPTIYR